MVDRSRKKAVNRRDFLAQTGTGLLAAAVPASAASFAPPASVESANLPPRSSFASGAKKKIPIGVFDPVYDHLGLDQMLDKEIGRASCRERV